ncbi:hypothetical protein DEDE109153_02880 [Deinococcus deserti]|uniref:Uncharacterized protein n=1 Tax=Deinococcus deserti (strain DSM 17065 / CIP 109153 / LMG 22923 / VCD115) TaxID=546414 RepID=C1CUN6_DEIDV|nr:hypothetical protein [Deinococcus deserti]ACO45903.1 hypothetical protein Deide_10201 [Deinococcus deserti VCD115]
MTQALSNTLTDLLQESALARPVDLRYASNRYAVGGAVAAAVTARLLGGSWADALGVGGAAFLAWATARELDPDHSETATVALPVAAAAAWMGGPGNPLSGLAALSALRVMAGTVGRGPTAVDLAALAGQAGLSAACGEKAAALLPAVTPYVTPGAKALWPMGGALVPALSGGAGASLPASITGLAALILAPRLIEPELTAAECDHPPRTVQPVRVQRARQAAVLTILGGVVTGQTRSLVPLAAAALAVGLRRQG